MLAKSEEVQAEGNGHGNHSIANKAIRLDWMDGFDGYKLKGNRRPWSTGQHSGDSGALGLPSLKKRGNECLDH